VSSDGAVVAHWHSDTLPKKSTPPKHTYVLEKCFVIEFKTTRPYAFKLKDRRSKDEIVFACDNVTEYASWLSFLTDDGSAAAEAARAAAQAAPRDRSRSPDKQSRGHGSGSPGPHGMDDQDQDQDGDETVSGYNEMQATIEDKINDFFYSRDTNTDKEISIRATEFWDLMKVLEERISITTGRQAIAQLTRKSGVIFYKDFMNWWRHRLSEDSRTGHSTGHTDTSSVLRSHIGLAGSKAKEGQGPSIKGEFNIFGSSVPVNHLHFAGMLDAEMSQDDPAPTAADGPPAAPSLLHTSAFIQQKLPAVKNILTEWAALTQGDSWNDRLQASIEDVLAAQNCIYEAPDSVTSGSQQALLESYFQYFAVLGQFYAAARLGAQTIVDEYSLPDSMRSAVLVNLSGLVADEDGTGAGAGGSGADIEAEEVFLLDGLVFRLVAVPASSRDLEMSASDAYTRYVTATDTVKHKMAGGDARAYHAVQRAVLSLFTNDTDTDTDIRPCTVGQTVVDYSGYRVQVCCPLPLEERRTLKYGQASSEDIFICRDIPGPDAEGGGYQYPKLFMQLAEKLNLRQRLIRTVVSDGGGDENVHVYESSEMILTRDMQLHQSDDDRFYMVNFSNLLPPEVPSPESNDVLTKQFRPEFLCKNPLALSPEALSIENAPLEGEGEATERDSMGAKLDSTPTAAAHPDRDRKQSVIAQNVAKLTVDSIIQASKKLKNVTIVRLVKKLDYMVVFPMESFGLTRFMHSNGVNCRHLGVMYELSSVFHVRQLLLCEAVARSVKTLLKLVLQRCSRRGRAEGVVAQERGRSREAHFLEHQEALLAAKRLVVVDMFNMALGHGERCDGFWTGLLPSTVQSKFGLHIPSNHDRSTLLHAFQLFEAMQYHCGVTFRDSNQYLFHNPLHPEPFRPEDLVDHAPVVKAEQLYPGADHDLAALSAAYMRERMYSDALNSLRIHMSAVVLSQGTQVMERFLSPKQRALTTYLTYDIALCHFLLKQYEQCSHVLLGHLESSPKYTVLAARMLTLLMCSTFHSGSGSSDGKSLPNAAKINTALQYFESAKMMYYLALGSQHPAVGLHVCALADLYFESKALPQARVTNMVALGSFKHALGDMHPVCAGVAVKLGNLLLADGQHSAAVELLEGAFAAYQHVNRQAAAARLTGSGPAPAPAVHVYYSDEAHCLHALAVALRGKSEVSYAMQCAVLSVDIATGDGRAMSPGTVHTLLLLAEMYEASSDLFTAVALYQDVWNIVKTNPHIFPMASMLLDLAGRLVRVIVDMLPLQARTLIDTIMAESIAPSGVEWDMAQNMLVTELWTQPPVAYIRDTIKQALEEAGETGVVDSLCLLAYAC
jgi:tetratricopeptide (TPR) repeat protein